ncbi:MAG: zf-HC2 domain-containing protein [Chloroflexi bacterium]|nr:zf-HC2 domain-containing protein [Chloroflexota bacterium]
MFNRKHQITDMDAWVEERLSDYLDGTLSPQERASVEAHLRQSAHARASLEALRWTVNLLEQTPAPALPRQFTLPVTQRAPARGAPAWLVWSLRGVAVAATAAFVVLLTATLLRQNAGNGNAFTQSAAPAAPSALIALAPTAPATFPARASQPQANAAEANATPSLLMVTVAPAQPTSEIMPVTVVPSISSNALVLPTATANSSQDVAPPGAPPAEQPTAAAVQKAQPTNASASASDAAGATPELGNTEPSPTSDSSTQRTIGVEVVEGVVTTFSLKVREGPGIRYRTIGGLKRGDRVFVIGRSQDRGWYLIQFEKNLQTGTGWIAAPFVQLNASPDLLPIAPPPEPTQPAARPTIPTPSATPSPSLPASAMVTPPADDQTPSATPTEPAPATPTSEANPEPTGQTPSNAQPAATETPPGKSGRGGALSTPTGTF